jgi:hypothetical protein
VDGGFRVGVFWPKSRMPLASGTQLPASTIVTAMVGAGAIPVGHRSTLPPLWMANASSDNGEASVMWMIGHVADISGWQAHALDGSGHDTEIGGQIVTRFQEIVFYFNLRAAAGSGGAFSCI